LEHLRVFLHDAGLSYDERVGFSVCVVEERRGSAGDTGGEIIATGSLDGNVLKCIAVSPLHQSEGLAARVVTELVQEAARNGRFHLFIYTKPANEALFTDLGFYPIANTDAVLLMENKRDGVTRFVADLKKPPASDGAKRDGVIGAIGAVVANCNPFTKGHLYLIENAARQCSCLHLLILSEDRSSFSTDTRWSLVQAGVAHIPNVILHPTGPYLVSAATFPDYFLKDTVSPQMVNTALDIAIFAERFARPLGITHRFVGTEPFDPVTAAYNQQMKELLPGYGITLVEMPRLESDGNAVSASRVRRLLQEKNLDAISGLVPATTYDYLTKY
jgi:[citrate (pro-3S)-lyase] ligase